MNLRNSLIKLLGGTPPTGRTSSVSAQVDDSPGWQSHTHAPGDRPWGDVYADLEDALQAWRKNFLIRRIVNLTRSYAVGSGIALSCPDPDVNRFLHEFWTHPKNQIDRRLGPISDQLVRDGELFPVLFTNPVNGMSYLRFKTARQIREVITDPDDYEYELSYLENTTAKPRTWISPHHSRAQIAPPRPVMLHWHVNKPLDATRGESDLTPILPWALRYSEWLKDRVRLNRQRTRQGVLDVTVADDTQVEQKRQQLRQANPINAGIYVHGPGEEVKMHELSLEGDDAEPDGKAIRLAIATGANLALHYLGEGESTNYATAKEMGEPTTRFYADRQQEIIWMLSDLATVAYRRYCLAKNLTPPDTLNLNVTVTEVARADNETLSLAALNIIRALAIASEKAWIDDQTALELALKFAGETLPDKQIRTILRRARRQHRNDEKNGDASSPADGQDSHQQETPNDQP